MTTETVDGCALRARYYEVEIAPGQWLPYVPYSESVCIGRLGVPYWLGMTARDAFSTACERAVGCALFFEQGQQDRNAAFLSIRVKDRAMRSDVIRWFADTYQIDIDTDDVDYY